MRPDAPAEVRLGEFQALRDEIQRRSTIQHALLGLNMTVVAGVLGLAINKKDWALLLIVPVVSPMLGLLWVDNATMIARLANYIFSELWIWRPSWERHLRGIRSPGTRQERWRAFMEFWVPIGGAFGGPPIPALIGAGLTVSDLPLLLPLGVLGAALTALCGYALTRSRRGYERAIVLSAPTS